MPASSLFAEMERPTSNSSNVLPNSSGMDENMALQIALELSRMGFSTDGSSGNDADFGVPGLSEADRTKRSQNMTECVAVPSSEHVAEIVGRQGCKIKALRAKTNTYIKTPVRGEEPVFVVTGRKEDVASAKREILSAADHFSQIRACRKNNLNGSLAPGPPTNVPGQITIQVRVPYRVVGLVVGPKGATIKRIQQTTHTYIVTPSRDKEPVFEVTGLPESVEQARKEIEAHIAMRTGGSVEGEEGNPAAAAAAAAAALAASHRGDLVPHGGFDSLFGGGSSADIMSSLYKINGSGALNGFNTVGINGLNGASSALSGLTGMSNGLSSGLTNGMASSLTNTMNSLNSMTSLSDINFLLGGDPSSGLLGSKSSFDTSLFSSITSSKLGDLSGSGLGGFYSVDEGLGSLGSSMGSSPSFDPTPASIWGDIGRSLGPTLTSNINSNGSLNSNLSSLSSLTRRSSSVSGASPPSSRLSPTLENHPPARRISSEPAPGLISSALTTLNGGSSNGILAQSSSSNSSPASTPELGLASTFTLPSAISSSVQEGGSSTSSSPTPGGPEKRCRSCTDAPVVAALVPCGHNLFCMDCAQKMVSEGSKCTICFEDVAQAIRIYS